MRAREAMGERGMGRGFIGGTPRETRVEGTRAAGRGEGVCIYTYVCMIRDVLLV